MINLKLKTLKLCKWQNKEMYRQRNITLLNLKSNLLVTGQSAFFGNEPITTEQLFTTVLPMFVH